MTSGFDIRTLHLKLQPADIVIINGQTLLSKAIKRFTKSIGESRTIASHVGIGAPDGDLIEALWTVKKHKIEEQYEESINRILVYRNTEITKDDRIFVAEKALEYVGRYYGPQKILAHAIDHILFDIYLFRKLCVMDNYPICSWVVAYAYDDIGYRFGVEPKKATPDDIYDHIVYFSDWKKVLDIRGYALQTVKSI